MQAVFLSPVIMNLNHSASLLILFNIIVYFRSMFRSQKNVRKKKSIGITYLTIFCFLAVTLSSLPVLSNSQSNLSTAREKIRTGRIKEALDILDNKAASAPTDSQFFFLKGRAFQELKRNTEALSNYSIALYLNPKFTNALINRALVKGALQDVEGALKDLDQALTLEPSNKAALLNRGVTYGGLNKPLLAIADFDQALKIDPSYADAYRNRGLTRHLLGDKKGACDDWVKSNNLGIRDAAEWLAKLCL